MRHTLHLLSLSLSYGASKAGNNKLILGRIRRLGVDQFSTDTSMHFKVINLICSH